MIDYKYKKLFSQDSVNKQLIIAFDDEEITNEDFYSEEFELTERLCSESELRFGSCEASMLKFKMRNEFGELKNKWLTVSTVLDGNVDTPFQFGKYKVFSDEPSGDKLYTNIVAYDAMYDVINKEMITWYDGLTFPISMKEFRNSFFAHFGIAQEETTLIQDEMIIEKTIDADSISGKDIITSICELNGVFGHINRKGNFEYISLERKFEYLHPGSNVYPGRSIYPGMILNLDYAKHDIAPNLYRSCEYEDFETELITKVQIRQEEGDIGAISGKGSNCYVVEDNFLVYGKSSKELSKICSRLFGKIFGIQYRPFRAVVKGNPCIEVGDMINIQAKYKDIEGYVLERTITGIQSLKDTFEAKGVQKYTEKVNSVNKEISRLKSKTNVLTRTVEETVSLITDEENGLQTQIKQNAESIQTKVSKGDVSSEISQEAGKVEIKGDRLIVESKNFTLDENGNLYITGIYTATRERTIYASDYSQEDLDRMQLIATHEVSPTSEDLEKYDFRGNGEITSWNMLIVQKMILGIEEWYKFIYRITIDPFHSLNSITSSVVYYGSNSQNEKEIETSSIGSGYIETHELKTSVFRANLYMAYNDEFSNYIPGATAKFTTADGKTVTVDRGIITLVN